MDDTDDPAFVQSLARGLSVLLAFGPDTQRMSLSDVARATALSRATARRFLLTLERLGYVRSNDREFSLTPRVLQLGFSYLSTLSLPQVAQPHLEQLSQEVGESTSASVLDGVDIVYVARVPARRIMSISITVGTRFPAYATSMGRVMLAALSTHERDDALGSAKLRAFTPRTIIDAAALRAELAHVSTQGWALVDQELELGLLSIAAPVRRGGAVVGAINVSTAVGGDPVPETVARLLPPLLATSRSISAELDDVAGRRALFS